MVFKKSFTLFVATKTIPFFVDVPIISDQRCSYNAVQKLMRKTFYLKFAFPMYTKLLILGLKAEKQLRN